MDRTACIAAPLPLPPCCGPPAGGGGSAAPVRPARAPKTATAPKTERPKLYRVLLLNDDYTPRDFVVEVLKAEFAMGAERAHHVMITAHRKGRCFISVYPRDVAETKAARASDHGRKFGFPLRFIAEPEE